MYLSLERAVQVDKHATDELEFSEDTYRQPVLAEGAVEPQLHHSYEKEEHDQTPIRQGQGMFHDDSGKIV